MVEIEDIVNNLKRNEAILIQRISDEMVGVKTMRWVKWYWDALFKSGWVALGVLLGYTMVGF